MIGAGIYDILKNDTDVAALVSEKIYPIQVKEGDTSPYISYQVISVVPSNTKQTASLLDRYRVQISSFATTYPDALNLAKKVRIALDNFGVNTYYTNDYGIKISSIDYDGEISLYIDSANIFEIAQDYIITAKIYIILISLASDQSTLDQNTFTFQLPVGKTICVDWGDGNEDTVNGNGANDVTATSNYLITGTYNIKVTGSLRFLTKIDIHNESNISGDISNWSDLTNLTYISCYNTAVSGDISGWSGLTNLTYINCYNTSVSGNVSGWSILTNLTYISCGITSIMGDISGWSALVNLTILACQKTSVEGDISGWSALINLTTLLRGYDTSLTYNTATLPAWSDIHIEFKDCAWTSAIVDQFLIDLAAAGGTDGILNIAGTNAARTSSSDAAKATLITNGWTITVNE